jgi:hypothetical protein
MKQYNTVYVPDRNGNFKLQEFEEDYHEWRDVHSEEALSAKSNVICMTIEELREVYNAGGADRCAISEGNYSHSFDKFITSKGIIP